MHPIPQRGELMDRKQLLLRFITDYRKKHGYPPSVREIGPVIGTESTSQVHYYLDALVAVHLLYRTPGVARGLHISMKGRAYIGALVAAKGASHAMRNEMTQGNKHISRCASLSGTKPNDP